MPNAQMFDGAGETFTLESHIDLTEQHQATPARKHALIEHATEIIGREWNWHQIMSSNPKGRR